MKVFLSYRRQDLLAMGLVRSLYERLSKAFGSGKIFMDADTIPPGRDFRDVLAKSVKKADVLLALIGPQWAEIQAERRDAPIDHVRTEIDLALSSGIPVVPILIGETENPDEADLHPDIAALASCQSHRIDPTKRFDADVTALIKDLKAYHRKNHAAYRPAKNATRVRALKWMSAGFALVATATLGTWGWLARQGVEPIDYVWTVLDVGPVSGERPSRYQIAAPTEYELYTGEDESAFSDAKMTPEEVRRANERLAQNLNLAVESATRGRDAASAGDFEAAAVGFHAALDLLPDREDFRPLQAKWISYHGDALYQVALSMEQQGRFAEAVARVEDLIATLEPGEGSKPAKLLTRLAGKRLKRPTGGAPLDQATVSELASINQALQTRVTLRIEVGDTLESAVYRLKGELGSAVSPIDPLGVGLTLSIHTLLREFPVGADFLPDVTAGEALASLAQSVKGKVAITPYSVLLVPAWDDSYDMQAWAYPIPEAWQPLMETDPGSLPPVEVPGESLDNPSTSSNHETESLLPSREPFDPFETWVVSMEVPFPWGTAVRYDADSGNVILYGTPATHARFERIVETMTAAERPGVRTRSAKDFRP